MDETLRVTALPVPMVCPACGTEYKDRDLAVHEAVKAGRSMEAGVDYLQCPLCTLSYNEAHRAVRDALSTAIPRPTRNQKRNQQNVSHRSHRS